MLQTVGINLMINFMPGIGWRAHFGGALTGLLLIIVLNEREINKDLKRNGMIALAVLCIISVFAIQKRSDLSNDEIYLLTDENILRCESELGLSSYAANMAKKLDRVYDSDYLEQKFPMEK